MKYTSLGIVAALVLSVATPMLSLAQTSSARSTVSCPVLTRNLGYGSKGADVIGLQVFLAGQQALSPDNITGFFGKGTETAVKLWQSTHGIVSSGSPSTTGYGAVGKKTRNAIAALCAK